MQEFRNNPARCPQNRSPFRPRGGTYAVANGPDNVTDVYLYDEIGFFGITAERFIKDLNAVKAKTINLRINSPGGDVFDGASIVNAIQRHSADIFTYVDGIAASMASMIAIAGKKSYMADNAFLMMHNPWTIALGDAAEMRKQASLLDKIGAVLAKGYADKSGKSLDDIQSMMTEETWLNADEALDMGMIDGIDNGAPVEAARASFDLSIFSQVPKQLKSESGGTPAKRLLEDALQAAGCSDREAKAILSGGFDALTQRDADAQSISAICGAIEAANARLRSLIQ